MFFLVLQPGNTKGKKKGGNIRQAPYYIKDGDTIGVKVRGYCRKFPKLSDMLHVIINALKFK